jgi:hypothetical protein
MTWIFCYIAWVAISTVSVIELIRNRPEIWIFGPSGRCTGSIYVIVSVINALIVLSVIIYAVDAYLDPI